MSLLIVAIDINCKYLLFMRTHQIMLFRWLHKLSETSRNTVGTRRHFSVSHPNNIVQTISDDLLEHGHLHMWHRYSIEIGQFLHERLGIQDLRDLRYATNADIEGMLAGAVSQRSALLRFLQYAFCI